MKKILFYTMTMCSGGAERVIANLSNELVKHYEVTISTLVQSKVDYKLDKKIKIVSASNNNQRTWLNRIKSIKNLYKITCNANPDAIIAFCPTMCFIACLLKKFSKRFKTIKLIISERNDPNNEYNNLFLKGIANYLYTKADIIVFQNEGAKAFFNKNVQKKGVIIPNPINDSFLKNKKVSKKENVIVNVGRLEPQKNQELLIKACAEVFKERPKWKLIIYGDGSLRSELEKLIYSLKMKKNIYLLGRCDRLEEELPKNKIFVLSSNYEGMPNALMEAMACGLTCISTDCPCGGPRSLITHKKNGYLVEVDNLPDLKSTILEAICNPLCAKEEDLRDYYSQNIYNKWAKLLK